MLHLNRVALTLVLRLPEHIFVRHLPASPRVVGDALAERVQAYSQTHALGYFPALDFFRQPDIEFDSDLLDAADHMAWFVCQTARDEVQRKLRPVFSNLNFVSVQSQAFTMPTVRPAHINARQALAQHYTPDTVKLILVASSFQKSEQPQTLGKWASHMAYRWLKDSFEQVEVTSAQAVADGAV